MGRDNFLREASLKVTCNYCAIASSLYIQSQLLQPRMVSLFNVTIANFIAVNKRIEQIQLTKIEQIL